MAAKWEAQAQSGLAQNERLKDLLEESAAWPLPGAGGDAAQPAPGRQQQASSGSSDSKDGGGAAGGEAAAAAADGTGGEVGGAAAAGDTHRLAALCQRYERELLEEKAKAARLDLQVRYVGQPERWEGAQGWGLAWAQQGSGRPALTPNPSPLPPLNPTRGLCMELTRAAQSSRQMQAALMPMLGGVEARLVQVLGLRPRAAALQPGPAPPAAAATS